MGYEYVAFQLLILVGLLAMGIYIILTDDAMQRKIPQIEVQTESREIKSTGEELEIKFPDVAYIQCECIGCERYMAKERIGSEDNIPDAWEDI